MTDHKIVNGVQVPLSEQDLLTREADDTRHLEKKISERYSQVKAIAYSKIVAIAPEWKQRNLIARAIEVVEINGSATPEEQAELEAMKVVWSRIKAIRAYSDFLEQSLNAAEDKLAVDITSGWPE